jgi:hypothetical protein
LGKGMGFRWFARTTLYWQEWLREKLKLQGGDDRIALLTEGLFVEDKGSNTANSVMGLLKQHGEKAVPYIEAAIKKHADKDPWKAVHALAFIPGDRSDGLLRSLYASENEKLSGAAAYALIHPPYRQAAREAYLDMLRRQTYVYQAAEACVEFQWKEAVPILREICEKPASWGRFRGALEAKRRLEGRPVPEDMRQAEQTIRSVTGGASPPDDRALDKAKRLLMESPDKEAATVAAVALAVHVAMASHAKVERVRRAGREILRTLPAEDVRKLLKTLLAGMKDKDEGYWREYAELLRWLDAAQPALPRSSDGGPKGVPAPAAERKQ